MKPVVPISLDLTNIPEALETTHPALRAGHAGTIVKGVLPS